MTMFTDDKLPQARPRILVAGLGNSILRDDGIGVHAALSLARTAPEGVLSVEVGTAVLDALHLLEWADCIVAIDAMEAGGESGDIYLLDERGLGGGTVDASLHELGFKAALRFASRPVTDEIIVVGVEPETIDYGLDLTPPLQAALPRVVALVQSLIRHWQQGEADADTLRAVAEMAGALPLSAGDGTERNTECSA